MMCMRKILAIAALSLAMTSVSAQTIANMVPFPPSSSACRVAKTFAKHWLTSFLWLLQLAGDCASQGGDAGG